MTIKINIITVIILLLFTLTNVSQSKNKNIGIKFYNHQKCLHVPQLNFLQKANFKTSNLDSSQNNRDRNIFKEIKRYFFIYMKDGWYLISSPLRINKKGICWLGGISIISVTIYLNDQKIIDAVHRNRNNSTYKFFLDIGDKIEPYGIVRTMNPTYAAGAVVGYFTGLQKLEDISIQLHEALLLGSFTRKIAVYLAGRSRPYQGKGAESFGNKKGTSFFSGHTSTAFQMATIISHHVNYWPMSIFCYGLASSMALQRLDANAHWPSDIFLGTVYGIAVAKVILKSHENRKIKIIPNISSNSTGFQIIYKF